MIDNDDSMQLSEYCFNLCESLETVFQGMVVDDLNGYVRASLGSLERCAKWP